MARITDYLDPDIVPGSRQDLWARNLLFSKVGDANFIHVDEFTVEVEADINLDVFKVPLGPKRDHTLMLELEPDASASEGRARLTVDGVSSAEANYRVEEDRLVVQALFNGGTKQQVVIERDRGSPHDTHFKLWGKLNLYVHGASA